MSSVAVSCPGKLILIGEHAAVYGRPALVAAVDLRLRAEIRALPNHLAPRGEVHLAVPALGVAESTSWAAVRAYTEQRRSDWERAQQRAEWEQATLTPGRCAGPRATDAAHLVKIALGEAARELHESAGTSPPLALWIESQLPVGSGFGSSAAAAVAVVFAYLAWRGATVDADRLLRLSLEVERRQHGTPSGVDNATVIHGGVLQAQRQSEGGVATSALTITPGSWLESLRVYPGGSPAESTGEVVAAVRAQRERNPRAFESRLDRLEAATAVLRAELAAAPSDARAVLAALHEASACLESFGVVPPPVVVAIRALEAAGGAAKVSGAGALTGSSGGTLLAYHPDPERLDAWAATHGLQEVRVTLGAAGARREPATAKEKP